MAAYVSSNNQYKSSDPSFLYSSRLSIRRWRQGPALMSAINGGCPLHYPITTRKPCSSPRGLGFATRGRRFSSSPEAKLKVADSCRARPPRREPVLTAAPATAVSPVTRRGGAETPNDPSFQVLRVGTGWTLGPQKVGNHGVRVESGQPCSQDGLRGILFSPTRQSRVLNSSGRG